MFAKGAADLVKTRWYGQQRYGFQCTWRNTIDAKDCYLCPRHSLLSTVCWTLFHALHRTALPFIHALWRYMASWNTIDIGSNSFHATCLVPWHYLNQYWPIFNWLYGMIFSKISINENSCSRNCICELSRPFCFSSLGQNARCNIACSVVQMTTTPQRR